MARFTWSIGFAICLGSLATPLSPLAGQQPQSQDTVGRPQSQGEVLTGPGTKFATPRETLKTLYFSITAYDFHPDLIDDAVACLERNPDQPREIAESARLAIQLDAILRELCLPVNGVPDRVSGDTTVVYDADGFKIGFNRRASGEWRFDRDTVDRIPAMYRQVLMRHREVAGTRAGMREEYTDPSSTMRRFLIDSLSGDFYAAGQALDLSRLPTEQRSDGGPYLAQQLMYVIQRRGWIYFQEVPNSPDSVSYTWHADREGRIVLERVRCADGKDAWLFSRNTVKNLAKMYQACLNAPPDPRFVLLGRIVPPVVNQTLGSGSQRPDSVPASLGSPRALLEGFFRTIDEAETDDRRLQEIIPFLDLEAIPAADRPKEGVKLANKLDVILRNLEIDLAAIPDTWNAPAQTLGKERKIRVELVRLRDGTWRFSSATVAQIPQLFDQMASQKQTDTSRTGHQESARDTMVSFLSAVNHHQDDTAARCLDLDSIHLSVREETGRKLAFKLKYVIDRIARVYPQEVPDEPEGPRYVFHSGDNGRIVIARRADGPDKGKWFFTGETVEQIEPMFLAAIHQPVHASLNGVNLRKPTIWETPGIWLKLRIPEWATVPVGGLELYQWLGLVATLCLSWLGAKLSLTCLQNVGVWLLQRSGSVLTTAFVNAKLRPLIWVCTCWLFFKAPLWLDFPLPWLNTLMPARTFFNAGLLGWLGFQLIDLIMAVYTNSEYLRPHRSLSDMIVPVSMRLLKGSVFLLVLGYVIYHVGHGDSLIHFFTGLGMAGLAASLAAQDILKSFFGTLLLIGERSFKLGDRIKVEGQEGIVEQVGFRSTRLRTPDGSLVTIPNATITSASIDNQGSDSARHHLLAVALSKDLPLRQMTALRESLHGWLQEYAEVDPEKCNVKIELHREGGVELQVNFTLREGLESEEMSARQEITYTVLKMVQGLGQSEAAVISRQGNRNAA